MYITFTKFHPEHLALIAPHGAQVEDAAYLRSPEAVAVLAASFGLTAWRGGRPLGAAGIVEHWRGRAEAWTILSEGAAPALRPILGRMRLELDRYPARRLEMTVIETNEAGHRLARLLGFRDEAKLEAYTPDGVDAVLYTRIRRTWQR